MQERNKGDKMLKNIKLEILLSSVLLFGLVQIGLAEEQVLIYELEEIVVSATGSERAIKDLSATVSVITRDEIEASNANSCTDILNSLPGLFVHKTGSFGRADVDIRGIGERGRKIMVLIDGRPVKMGLFGCTITHSLPLSNVERIEVVRGPLSVLYGSDALGGVINIITRKIKDKFETDLVTSGGTHNTQHYRLLHGGYVSKFDYYVTIDKRSSDGHLDNSAYDGKDFSLHLGYGITDDSELTFTGKYFDGYKEEPSKKDVTTISDTWNDYKRGALDLTLTKQWEYMDGLIKTYRNFGEHEFSDGWHSKDVTNGIMLNGSKEIFDDNELTVGAEFRQQTGESINWPKGKWDKNEYAVYFHDEQTLFEKLTVTFGARYNEDEVSGSEFCPQGGLVFSPKEGTILRGLVNKGFRSPQINELYMFPPSNEDLKPEVVINYEIGVNQRIVEGVNVDMVGYIMKGKDLIEIKSGKFKNIGEFEFKGIETGLNAQLSEGISGRLYYTYFDPGKKTTGRPGTKVDLSLRYTKNPVAVSLSGQYIGDYYAEDDSQSPIDDYFIANTKLSYEIVKDLKVFLAVDNILNNEYGVYANLAGGSAGVYSMPRRTFTAGLNYKF